jgi:hypothetical protein
VGFLAVLFGALVGGRARRLTPLLLAALVAAALLLPRTCLFARSHDLIVLVAFSGLPVLLDRFCWSSPAPVQRLLLSLCVTSVGAGLVTTWTANCGMFNFPVGALLAVVARLAYLEIDSREGKSEREVTRLQETNRSRVCGSRLFAPIC